MRRLRQRFPDHLVVLGVHSAKFTAEKETSTLREAVERLGVEHPVVNDAGFDVWESFAVRAWPTLVLLDATGRVAGKRSGEVTEAELASCVERLIAEASEKEQLSNWAAPTGIEPLAHEALLRFPAKLVAVGDERLFVADTGHHRVVELELELDRERADGATQVAARVARTFGRGVFGFEDGGASHASFHSPHGLAVTDEQVLYVADTGNHALRAIDLEQGTVGTVAGTGALARTIGRGGTDPLEVALRSPWDLAWTDGVLLIAMAGSHQIWGFSPKGPIGPFAGRGAEVLLDGPLAEAGFNQPSGLALVEETLFVADAEASAIRAVTFGEEPRVTTLVGQGLFEFGDVDGTGEAVRLQHPAGVAADAHFVYIADSYNHKIKRLERATGRVETLVGDGRPGERDGSFSEARLHEPEGLALVGDRLLIADTGNHRLRVTDLRSGRIATVEIRG